MRFLIIVLLCLIPFSIFSQGKLKLTELNQSEPIILKKRENISDDSYMTSYQDNIYLLKLSEFKNKKILEYKTGAYQLMQFDSMLNLKKSKDIGIDFKRGVMYAGQNFEIGFMDIFNEQIVIGVFEKSKRSSTAEVYIHMLNPETLEPTMTPKKVLEIDFKGLKKHRGDFGISISPNRNKLIVYASRNIKKSYELKTVAFDQNLEPIWRENISDNFEVTDAPPVRQVLINDEGVGFFLLRAKEHKDKKFLRISSTQIDHLPIPDYRMKHMKMGFDHNQKLNMLGFYSTTGWKTNGLVLIKLDEKNGKLNFDMINTPIPDEYHAIYKRKPKKGNRSNKDDLLFVTEIYQKENGNWVVAGHTTYVSAFKSSSQTMTQYNWYFRNIVAFEITQEGEIVWQQKIPYHKKVKEKSPYVKNTPDKRYLFFPFKDHIHLIFRDDVDNENYDGDGRIKFETEWCTSHILQYSIDPQGELSRSILFNKKKDKIGNYFPSLLHVFDESKILLFVKEKKKVKVIQMGMN